MYILYLCILYILYLFYDVKFTKYHLSLPKIIICKNRLYLDVFCTKIKFVIIIDIILYKIIHIK